MLVGAGEYGGKPWFTDGSDVMPPRCGEWAPSGACRELWFNTPMYWECGLGEVADETDEESYDLVERFGERG